jgi:hypothetical protein
LVGGKIAGEITIQVKLALSVKSSLLQYRFCGRRNCCWNFREADFPNGCAGAEFADVMGSGLFGFIGVKMRRRRAAETRDGIDSPKT